MHALPHRRLVWVFAGSHAIDELALAAEWRSHFVSLRTLTVPMFSLEETRLLLTEPLKHSPLWRADDPRRPRFDPAVWGAGGIERIHAEAGGWPHLVQLIAENVVALLNERGARQMTDALFDDAVGQAVGHGDIVLSRLLKDECRVPGEWDWITGFCNQDCQPAPDQPAVRQSLKRRELVDDTDPSAWRLRVPLMQRWLRKTF